MAEEAEGLMNGKLLRRLVVLEDHLVWERASKKVWNIVYITEEEARERSARAPAEMLAEPMRC